MAESDGDSAIRTAPQRAAALLARVIALGVTDAASVARDGARLTPHHSRHRNVRLARRDGRGWFLKEGDGGSGFGTIAHERSAYRALSALLPPGPALGVPEVAAYDAAADLLVLALVPDATDLARIAQAGEPLGALPAALGTALATLHGVDAAAARAQGIPVHLGTTIFQLDAPTVGQYCRFSRAQIELVTALQAQRGVMDALARLGEAWRPERLIHFDIRLANVLAADGRLTLVDFEYLGVGDPRWDMAGMLAAFLEAWLVSAPLGDPDGGNWRPDEARFSEASARAAIRTAWEAYRRTPGAPRIGAAEAARFAGARLVQGAYEHAAGLAEPDARVATLAAMGAEFLEDPERAAAFRLGLSDATVPQ
ncbi:phosphotransferase family protein [Acuticoccus sediminis]|nr:aminoglycoside phosphotransferase family protein [Acuticoccus sediminis]